MCVYIYIHNVCMYIYIYIHNVCVYTYIYIYTYIYQGAGRGGPACGAQEAPAKLVSDTKYVCVYIYIYIYIISIVYFLFLVNNYYIYIYLSITREPVGLSVGGKYSA